jgi:hypothetical protein
MEMYDYSFILLFAGLILSLFLIVLILKKMNHKSGFRPYIYDLPHWKRYCDDEESN